MEDFKQIDVNEAKKIIDEGNVTIIDIRDPASFQAAHITNAIAITDENVESFIKSADKDKPLICYCYRGISSQGAAEYFKRIGFKEVYSLEGGFEKWKTIYPSASDEGD